MRKGKDGTILPAQVLAPIKFKDNRGNPISLKEISKRDEKGNLIRGENGGLIIDTEKLSPELLKSIGFRIPSQGPNSMAYIEIVGFLL